jgi:Trypsin
MRMIKTVGVCVVTAAAIGAALASASYADELGSEGSPFDKEIAVLTKRGISPARASQALDVQGKVARANLVSEVEAAMGSAYAGAWFEPAAAQIHFGMTSAASRRTAQRVVAQAGLKGVVAYTPVRSTWSELIAIQDQWGKRLAKLFANQEAMTGLDAQRNAVVVTLSSSVSPQERATLEREATTASVNVLVETASPSRLRAEPVATCKKFKTLEAYCEKTLVSGVGIAAGAAGCSAGPMLIEGNETYMLTAGHCFAGIPPVVELEGLVEENVTSAYPEKEKPEQKEIGKEGEWKYTRAQDMAIVKISAGSSFRAALGINLPALMQEWGKKSEEAQAVIGEAANVKGETNCRVGMTTGEQCGTIEQVNMEVNGFKHLVEDSACAEPGDSGGPFFFSNSKVNNVTMQGMAVQASLNCAKKGKTWYEPLKDEGAPGFGILSTFNGKRLLTTANETRRSPSILPELTEEKWTGESGTASLGVLKKAEVVECTKDKSEGSFEANKPLGLFHIDFEGCKSSGVKATCTGLGEASGVILMLGTAHLVFDKLGAGAELGVGVLFLIEATHFSCVIPLFIVEGQVLCLIKPINTTVKHWEIVCEKGKETGDPGETVYWNETGTEVKMGEELLLTKENEGAGVMSSESTTALILSTIGREIMG